MRKEFTMMSRGTGDCRIAGPEYEYQLDSTTEAQKIANAVHSKFHLVIKPKVTVLRKSPKRLLGTANAGTGLIRLMATGCNVGVLLHELAHLNKRAANAAKAANGFTTDRYGNLRRKRRVSHGQAFKAAHTKILLYWRSTLKDRFYNGDKVRVSPERSAPIKGGLILSQKSDGGFEIKPMKPTKVKIHIEKPEPIIDTDEEILELIEVAVEGIAKLTWNNCITMGGLVRAMRVRGVNNTPAHRDYAKKHAIEIGLTVSVKY